MNFEWTIKTSFIYDINYQMQKNNNQNQNRSRNEETRSFPHLRKTQSAVKNLMALNKVELDKNITNVQPLNQKPHREIMTSMSYKRLTKQVPALNSQIQFSKTYRKFEETVTERTRPFGINKQKSSSINNLGSQTKETMEKTQSQIPLIDKAKTSAKQTGQIRGYAVNSHPGPLNTFNEDRICVVTNLNKSLQKELQISFFSIYDGENGVTKAEFFRDNFHSTLIKDKDFFKDVELSIRRVLKTVEDNFNKSNSNEENCNTSVLIAITIENQVYIASMGENKMTASIDYGREIFNPLVIPQVKNRKKSTNKLKYSMFSQATPINVVKYNIDNLDFLILGSEGLFESFGEIDIGKKIWTNMFELSQSGFHIMLGQTINAIMNEIFQEISTKNVSIILIAFENCFQCFQDSCALQLPYVISHQGQIVEEHKQ